VRPPLSPHGALQTQNRLGCAVRLSPVGLAAEDPANGVGASLRGHGDDMIASLQFSVTIGDDSLVPAANHERKDAVIGDA